MVQNMTAPTPEVPALKAAIDDRMTELGLSPSALAAATGLTVQGLMNLRKGKRREYQRRLTGPVCAALGWTPDSIDRILAGGKPKLIPVDRRPDVLARLAALEADLEGVAAGLRELSDTQRELAEMAHTHVDGQGGQVRAFGR